MAKKIKVLVIDDSAVVRSILEKGLNTFPDIEVVGKAADVYSGRDKDVAAMQRSSFSDFPNPDYLRFIFNKLIENLR